MRQKKYPESRQSSTGSADLGVAILGIDVSKAKLDACIRSDGRKPAWTTVKNDATGFEALAAWITKHDVTLDAVGLEATSVYSRAVTEFFFAQGTPVYLANPKQVHAYMDSDLRRVKTDKVDAEGIAEFTADKRSKLHAWKPVPAHYATLRDLVRYLHGLKEYRASIKNRMEPASFITSGSKKFITKRLKDELKNYETLIGVAEKEIHKLLNANGDMKARYELLTSATSIGFVTATMFMAEVPDIRRFQTCKQLECFAGITPRIRHSGNKTPESQPISKIGDVWLRTAFYMAALSGRTYNQSTTALAIRLREKNKNGQVINIAVARKLLRLVWAMEMHNTPFDPLYHKKHNPRRLQDAA